MQHDRRPVITLLTDFGPDGAPAVCRGVMLGIAPDAQIVDISHNVRKYAIRDGAFLLAFALPWMPIGVHVGVVDPGVGTARRPIGLLTGRGDVLIGPDNGLLPAAAQALGGLVEARALENRALMLADISSTFHGRDIFSPMAAHVAAGVAFASVGPVVDPATLVSIDFPQPVVSPGSLETTILFIASFGNLHLAGGGEDMTAAFGAIEPGMQFRVTFGGHDGVREREETVPWARTFGEIPQGEAMLYEDSSGRLGFADNQSSAASRLGAVVDQQLRIRRA